jgi:hypothetical protein
MVLGWCLCPALGFGLVFMFYILGFICSVASLGFALKSFELEYINIICAYGCFIAVSQ